MTAKLLLVDGHAVAYRAFYAIRNLRTRDGRPTNAVYGFINMLAQLRRQWQPSHAVVVFDGGLPAERMALCPDYKAQREAMPEELRIQFDSISDYLQAARVGAYRVDGEEADDVLATVTAQATESGAAVLIATHDKDLLQLVTDVVQVVSPTKSEERLGPQEVKQKTGVYPDQIAEWLALIGDTADNISGVPGVGPKTAARLLGQFQSVPGIYAHLNDISQEKLRLNLAAHRDLVRRNMQLTQLRRDVRVPADWQDWTWTEGDAGALLRFYREMEFHSMARPLENPTLLDL